MIEVHQQAEIFKTMVWKILETERVPVTEDEAVELKDLTGWVFFDDELLGLSFIDRFDTFLENVIEALPNDHGKAEAIKEVLSAQRYVFEKYNQELFRELIEPEAGNRN